jgi:serine/threonine-protein kinase
MSEAAERYRQAKAIFLLAAQRDGEQRARYVDEACAGDAELRREVEALLVEANTGDAMLDRLDRAPQVPTLPPDYRVLRELGRGGMGVVWLAERDAGDFKQKVALKLLGHDALRDPDRRARFRAERRILASLDHPHIARLLDGGALADGTPFLAMEFVEGERLDAWAERSKPALRDLLRMFVAICRAVQAAHQRLVVHRDLKPANILVDAYGAPKLLDFGIAKLLDDSIEIEVATGTGMQLLTPRYAAPEQVRGEAISTATDVYALGVILYELLTGASPYGRAAATPDQLRAICDTDPLRPSLVPRIDPQATSGTASSQLRGDLDAILLKCLRKAPAARYRGAAELADDIEAFLDGRPVAARAGSTRYALGKFIGRHRYLVASTLLVLGVLVAATVLLLRQLEETRAERDRAERQRDRAEQSLGLLNEVLASANPSVSYGKELTAREILAAAAEHLSDKRDVSAALRFELLVTIAGIESALGLHDSARTHLAIGADLVEANDLGAQERLAVERVKLLNATGELADAERLCAEVVARLDAGQSTLATEQIAEVLIVHGNTLNFLGRGAEAIAATRRALALLGTPGANPRLQVSAHSQLGQNLQNLGELTEAEEHLRESLRISLEQGFDPLRISRDRNNLAGVLAMQGRFGEALAQHRPAIEAFVEVAGREHPEYGVRLNNVGMTEYGAGELASALSHLQEAVALNRVRYGPQSHVVAVVEANLAGVLTANGEFAAARPLIGAAHAGLLAKYGVNSLLVLRAARVAGVLALEEQDLAAARRWFEACAEGARGGALGANPSALRCQVGLAELETYDGAFDAAANRLSAAEALLAKLDPRHFERGMATLVRARLLVARGAGEQARAALDTIAPESLNEPWQSAWRDLLYAAAAQRCDASATQARATLLQRHGRVHPRWQPLCAPADVAGEGR